MYRHKWEGNIKMDIKKNYVDATSLVYVSPWKTSLESFCERVIQTSSFVSYRFSYIISKSFWLNSYSSS